MSLKHTVGAKITGPPVCAEVLCRRAWQSRVNVKKVRRTNSGLTAEHCECRKVHVVSCRTHMKLMMLSQTEAPLPNAVRVRLRWPLKRQKAHKSPGTDSIGAELLWSEGNRLRSKILKVINYIWNIYQLIFINHQQNTCYQVKGDTYHFTFPSIFRFYLDPHQGVYSLKGNEDTPSCICL